MERSRSLRTRAASRVAVAVVAAAALAGGCQSAAGTRAAVTRAIGLSKPTPPTQFICVVDPTLQQLPDTTRNGQPAPLLVGKAYLFGANNKPVDADGQLTVVMNDTTARAAGKPPHVPVLVHIDPTKLKGLVASDERFGRHYVFPIPWPDDWGDVTHVTIQARFSPNKELKVQDLFNPESRFAVNTTGAMPVVIDKATGQPVAAGGAVPTPMGGVPDPNTILAGMKSQVGSGVPTLLPAGGPQMPITTAGPNGSRVTTGAWVAPAPGRPATPLQPQPAMPAMPTILPPDLGGGLPSGPVLPPGVTGGNGNAPFTLPPLGGTGMPPPPVGPIGELRSDGALQPVVISRQ